MNLANDTSDSTLMSSNITNDTSDTYELIPISSGISTETIVLKIILPLILLLGIAANTFIIYIFARYPRLRSKSPYVLMLNWVISDAVFLFFNPALMGLYFSWAKQIYEGRAYCLLSEIMVCFACIDLVFVYLITLDWCLADWIPEWSAKFRRFYKYIIPGVWVVSLGLGILHGVSCFTGNMTIFTGLSAIVGFIVLAVLVVLVNIIRWIRICMKKEDREAKLMLLLPTCFIACFVVCGVAAFIYSVTDYHVHPPYIDAVLIPIYLNSVLNLLFLIVLNKDFGASFRQVIKCYRYVNSPEEIEETLGEDSPAVRFIDNHRDVVN